MRSPEASARPPIWPRPRNRPGQGAAKRTAPASRFHSKSITAASRRHPSPSALNRASVHASRLAVMSTRGQPSCSASTRPRGSGSRRRSALTSNRGSAPTQNSRARRLRASKASWTSPPIPTSSCRPVSAADGTGARQPPAGSRPAAAPGGGPGRSPGSSRSGSTANARARDRHHGQAVGQP